MGLSSLQVSLILGLLACMGCSKASNNPGESQRKTIFLIRSEFNGNLGGLSGADQKCQADAVAAGLSGTFRALLSSSTVNAVDRLQRADYYLPNGVMAISEGNLANLIANLDVLADGQRIGNGVGEDDVWTGSTSMGITTGNHCADWTSDSASASGTTGDADDPLPVGNSLFHGNPSCDSSFSLYCFSD